MVDRRTLASFTRQLAAAVDSGLPVLQALHLLGEAKAQRTMRPAVEEVTRDLRAGATLADALRGQGAAFPKLYVETIAAGEASGTLDSTLGALATTLEKHHATALKVRSALIYPVLLVSLTVVGAVLMVPGTPGKLGAAAVAAAAIWLGRRWADPDGVRSDGMLMHIPVLGTVYAQAALARLTRTLGGVAASGIPIIEALRIGGDTSGSHSIRSAVMRSRARIKSGDTLKAALEHAGIFPPMVVAMAATGEETGKVDEMFLKIADYYDEQVDAAVKVAVSLLQPFAILVAAGMVLWLAMAML